jgi:hypothetical protein
MLDKPSTCSDRQIAEAEAAMRSTERRLLNCVERLLADIPTADQRATLYSAAFEGRDPFPKRVVRPKVEIAYLVERLADAHGLTNTEVDTLLEATTGIVEYYDMLDDIVDGDVPNGRVPEAVVLAQTLMPLFIRRLAALGADSADAWSGRASVLLEAPYLEQRADPSLDAYRAIVDRQSKLFGFVTCLPAVVADADSDAVDAAATVGERYYIYEQYLLDREQVEESSPWNLWSLASESTALDELQAAQDRAVAAIEVLLPEDARLVEPLIAHDLDAWNGQRRATCGED